MPHRVETGVRLNARMSKVSTEPTLSCGVQISDSWISAHHRAGEKPGDRSAGHQYGAEVSSSCYSPGINVTSATQV